MIAIKQSFEIIDNLDGAEVLRKIERCGRICYKSEGKISETSAEKFVKMLISRGHESVLEHVSVTVKLITSRAIANEIVRHRLASYSQESTRYCNYKDKGIEFVVPHFLTPGTGAYREWELSCIRAEDDYNTMAVKYPPEIARDVLPLCTKTEIIITADLREWRHILRLRTSPSAHPSMRELMIPLLADFKQIIPIIFDDIKGV